MLSLEPSHTQLVHVLVFDSGAGGLSVAREIIDHMPSIHLSYLADNLNYPYGELNEQDLENAVTEALDDGIHLYNPDLVVIACNTASTLLLDTLRKRYTIPFVGVVPAIKPAAKITSTGVIGVLATPQTVARKYTQALIQEHANNTQVILHGAAQLATACELWISEKQDPKNIISMTFKNFLHHQKSEKADVIVLACTHYPLVKPFIQACYPNAKVIDSGNAIAKRVATLSASISKFKNHTQNAKIEENQINVYLTKKDIKKQSAYLTFLNAAKSP